MVETLYNPAQNTKTLAETLVRAVAEAVGIFNRGAKPREDLAVLRKAGVPALIVETAFISNPEEERLLVAAEEQEKIARAIARVVDDYCARL